MSLQCNGNNDWDRCTQITESSMCGTTDREFPAISLKFFAITEEICQNVNHSASSLTNVSSDCVAYNGSVTYKDRCSLFSNLDSITCGPILVMKQTYICSPPPGITIWLLLWRIIWIKRSTHKIIVQIDNPFGNFTYQRLSHRIIKLHEWWILK